MLIAMAGLPGTGKSTVAAALAPAVGAVVLNKDIVRAALFPPAVLDYSAAQNDVAMAAIYAAARLLLRAARPVILDGRTFARSAQVQALLALAHELGQTPYMVECVCADGIVRERLERDRSRGDHPAGDRTFDLYRRIQAAAEPLTVPRLVLDTGARSLAECVAQAVAHLRGGPVR